MVLAESLKQETDILQDKCNYLNECIITHYEEIGIICKLAPVQKSN